MNLKFTNSTHSLTGKLALFFTVVSIVAGLIIYSILVFSLQW